MPNPHFRVEFIARSKGQSVVAASAYRSGEVLYDERTGKTFDYSRKEDIIHAEIMTPDNAPAWAKDRSQLWNIAEHAEKRSDAQLARTIIAALPRELDHEQNLALVRGYIRENFTSKGMIADFAIHESDAGDGQKNPHAHLLVTLRPIEGNVFGRKNREWSSKSTLRDWRNSWEEHTNRHLELAGCEERVSLKSYKDRKINRHAQIHLGEDQGNLEKRGIKTTRGNYNRHVQHENTLIEMFGLEAEDQEQDSEAQLQGFSHRFLNPDGYLEAMTVELEEDMESQDAGAGTRHSGKEIVIGAFKRKEKDAKSLVESSLDASWAALQSIEANDQSPDPDKEASRKAAKARHDSQVDEYIGHSSRQSPDEQVMEKVRLQERVSRREKAKAPGAEIERRSSHPVNGTDRSKEKDRKEERER